MLGNSICGALRAAIFAGILLPAFRVAEAETDAPELKQAYLACERRALREVHPPGETAWCSILYEKLKQTAFKGDWKALHIWTEQELAEISEAE